MTQDEFNQLSPFQQETFINDGGSIAPKICTQPITTPSLDPVLDGMCKELVESPPTNDTDKVTSSEVATQLTPSISTTPNEEWTQGFDIKDPVELLFLLDDDISSGIVQLHKWQVEFMLDFAMDQHIKDFPFRACVRACNGSGKDKYIVAACVVWICMRFKYARGVVTNGSGVQLDNQTEAYIRFLCQRVNMKFGHEVWKCNYRYYECLPTNSPITLFATDEPNKAEGYHPLQANAKMAIFASEAKAIPDEIFTALTRCTGFTHRVDVSTPGPPVGYFFNVCSTSIDRKTLTDIKSVGATDHIQYHITAFDCPHITKNEIQAIADALPGGENNPVYKSAVKAEFSTTDEMIVIPYTFIWKAVKHPPIWIREEHNKAGLDLSDGGAETVLLVRNGNKHLKTIPFKFDNTEDTLDYLEEQFKENDLTHKEAFIYADCCGIGKPMLNALRRRGWTNIRYVDSRHKALEPRVYFNRATELFFHVRILLERNELIINEEKPLITQLSTRYYKLTTKNIHQLLTKLEQRSRGYPSPDRADAFNLAFWDYKSTYKESDVPVGAPDKPLKDRVLVSNTNTKDFSLKSWAKDKHESLDGFRRNIAKQHPTTYLQKQIDRYTKSLN